MKTIVRPAYSIETAVFIIVFIFLVATFITHGIFYIPTNNPTHRREVFGGMFLVGVAVVLAVLIIWEELLFPVVMVKQNNDTLKVRNHRRKLYIQTFLYFIIPGIFFFIYMNFVIHIYHFIAWASICTIAPIVAKIFSGIKNYNDFLNLSPSEIEYKNNKKGGKIQVADVSYITVIKDSSNILSKLKLGMNNSEVTIDLDEMELEDFYDVIQDFIQKTYKNLVK